MPVDSQIIDGTGTKYATAVSKNNTLQVALNVPEVPPVGSASRERYFNVLMGTTGADSGSTDMVVNGSVTPVTFFVGSVEEYDIRITHAIITISDTSINLSKFGGLSALTTGWDLIMEEDNEDISIIDKAKTNGEIAIQSVERPNIYQNFAGANDGFVQVVHLNDVIKDGIRVGRGTQDRIKSVVNDALAGLVSFDVRIIGYRHYP